MQPKIKGREVFFFFFLILLENCGTSHIKVIIIIIYIYIFKYLKSLFRNHSFTPDHDQGIIITPILQMSPREGSEHLPQVLVTQPSRASGAF